MKFLPLIRRHPNRSMRARMTLAFALSIGLLLLVTDTSLIAYSRYSARKNAERLLLQSARELKAELKNPAAAAHWPVEFAREEGNELGTRGVRLILLDANGKVLVAPKKFQGSWPPREPRDETWRTERITRGAYSLVLAIPWNHRAHELDTFAWLLAALSTLVLAACASGAWMLVGRVLAPLEALSHQAQVASVHDASLRLQASSNDWEMTNLVATLNDLLERIEADARAKARFYAAASHELRTPLQSLNGFLELGLARPRPAGELRETLEEAHAQSRSLIVLVTDLLMLNQLETASARPAQDEVDLADVVERALQKLQQPLQEKNLSVEFEAGADALLHVPWSHIEMLARNLLENAAKYSTPGGTLRVRCDARVFEVSNPCPRITGWDDKKIFEPFFRPDASRNSQTGGNGLGLAICHAICITNKWNLRVQQTEIGVLARVIFSDQDSDENASTSATTSSLAEANIARKNSTFAPQRSFSL